MEGDTEWLRLFLENGMQYMVPCLVVALILFLLAIGIVIKHKTNQRDTLTGLPNREAFLIE